MVDLRECKRTLARILPASHPLRLAILGEPDYLPRAEGVAKVEAFLRILASSKPK